MCAPPKDDEWSIQLRASAPKAVAALFQQVLCSVRLAMEHESGTLPREGEAFEALLDHAVRAWQVEDTWLHHHAKKRLAIFERDGWRCTIPGCTSRRNLHLHHIVFRSAGGSDEASNQTTLCAFHHQRGVHEGRVRVSGQAPHHLVFELGTRPGHPPSARFRSGDRVATPR